MGKGIPAAVLLILSALFLGDRAFADDPVFWPEDTYNINGLPQHMHMYWDDPGNNFIPTQSLLDRIGVSLVETKDIRTFNPSAIASDNQSNILLAEDAAVYVTMLHDGAGYQNGIGYFSYVDGSPPAATTGITHNLIFPNASWQGSGGGLHLGDTVQIGGAGHIFMAGSRIGFFLVSDGWSGDPIDPVEINGKGIYYSLRDFNAETDEALRAHFVLLYEEEAGGAKKVVLGMEDIKRSLSGCDHDFNDVIFLVTTDPDDAIDSVAMGIDEVATGTVDTDGDDVFDENDAFPDDAARAFYSYYPAEGTVGTLAFEDLWPLRGDYDFNDLVVWFSFANVTDAAGQIKDVAVEFEIAAVGAGYHNGFSLLLPFPTTAVESAVLSVKEPGEEVFTTDPGFVIEASNDKTLAVLFSDAWEHITPPSGELFANTTRGTDRVVGGAFKLEITLIDSAILSAVPPYNPFLFRTGERGIEIHLIDQEPSVFADTGLFGTGDDRSNPAESLYYRTDNNLPWALHLPILWSHPAEKVDIVLAYPDLIEWAQSGGISNADWYLFENAVAEYLYIP
jgi:LruC domain-containing protein